MMYEGEDGNAIDLIYETNTLEANGVKVIVPVKFTDVREFKEKLRQQLSYFEDVFINAEGFDNNHVIYRNQLFQYSELSDDDKLHICLDNVYYPLDFGKLGISEIKVPVALRCSLTDGVYPTPNREAIRYTAEAKEIIINKIKQFAEYIITTHNTKESYFSSIEEWCDYFDHGQYMFKVGNISFAINYLSQYSSIQIKKKKLKGFSILDAEFFYKNRFNIFSLLKMKYYSRNGTITDCEKGYNPGYGRRCFDKDVYIISNAHRIKEVQKKYFRKRKKEAYFIQIKELSLFPTKEKKDSYFTFLNLYSTPKHLWRAKIVEFQKFVGMFIERMIPIEDFEVPQDFLLELENEKVQKKKASKGRKQQGEINGKLACPVQRHTGSPCKFVSTNIKLEDVYKSGRLYIYTTHDNSEALQKIYTIDSSRLQFITFSAREIKLIKSLGMHSFMSYEDFMSGKSKIYKRIKTAHLFKKFINKYESLYKNISILEHVSTPICEDLLIIEKYVKENFKEIRVYGYEEGFDHLVTESYDEEVMFIYNRLISFLRKHTLVNMLLKGSRAYDNFYLQEALVKILKYEKFRVNINNYKLKTNE